VRGTGCDANTKRRWCSGCAKAHPGAVHCQQKCEICKLKLARWRKGGRKDGKDGKKRWCAGCAKVHVGAANVV
jgi:hypothetical protein